ncbi:MAG: phosphoribosylamine--glycine ligase, partial [Bdellovibrionales bacterium]|nr:phosphoribosylamine--glycine ligase [Bdellovibrionales bacterium]
MNVLILGSGGREHALCEVLSHSDLTTKVIVAPGNAGMLETLPELQIESVDLKDHQSILKIAMKYNVGLTIVGPEALLSEGIVDFFQNAEMPIVGPTKEASLLESSKSYAKKVMRNAGVPTTSYEEFFDMEAALSYIENQTFSKMVVKCDGLAEGKGVVVCLTKNEARVAVISLMKESLLGANVKHIIIEEYLEGIEVSVFALCDGEDFTILGSACDHKRLFDNDMGPNTGGMGVFSPASIMTVED